MLAELSLLFMHIVTAACSANYIWLMYPIAQQALYGYDGVANKSYRSENISDGVKFVTEDGINALFVPAGIQVDLGDFAGTCVSNPNLCKNFTVSFLLKTAANKSLIVLDSGIMDPTGQEYEYGWSFKVNIIGDTSAAVVTSGLQGDGQDFTAKGVWIHMAFTSFQTFTNNVRLYQNGSYRADVAFGATSYDQDKNTHLKLGDVSNTEGFFISNLQFIGIALSTEETMKNGNNSFETAMWTQNVTIEILQDEVTVRAETGTAAIPVRRNGFQEIAAVVEFNTTDLTAKSSTHYVGFLDKQLVFAPGEVYKHVEIPIIRRAIFQGSKTFVVSFSNSPILKGPMKVKVTILYTGPNQPEGSAKYGKGCYLLVVAMSMWAHIISRHSSFH